jgi:hypothetical protein
MSVNINIIAHSLRFIKGTVFERFAEKFIHDMKDSFFSLGKTYEEICEDLSIIHEFDNTCSIEYYDRINRFDINVTIYFNNGSFFLQYDKCCRYDMNGNVAKYMIPFDDDALYAINFDSYFPHMLFTNKTLNPIVKTVKTNRINPDIMVICSE